MKKQVKGVPLHHALATGATVAEWKSANKK